MDEIRYWIETEGTGHWFFVAFPVVLVCLFIWFKDRKVRFLIPSLLISLVIINPIFFQKWTDLDLYAYWRLLWVVPVIPVVACIVPSITEMIQKSWKKAMVVAVGMLMVTFGGTFLYNGTGGAFVEAANMAKVPDYVVQIADTLLQFEGNPRVVAQYPIGVYIRQYSGEIDSMFGRGIDGYIIWSNNEARTINNQLNDPNGDLELVATNMANNGYSYLVLQDMNRESALQEAGFQLLDHISEYGIYLSHGEPDVIKQKDELGQVVSITTVDSKGNPINGDNGYSSVAYEYDAYGNVIREFHTDIDGRGVPDASGRAGYEREYDQKGHMLMERYIDVQGYPINNSAGFAEVRRTYRGNDIIFERYLDEEEKQVNRTDTLYASVQFDYDRQHHVINEKYYDAGGSYIISNLGYARVSRVYDNNGNLINEAYFDTNDNPVITPKGYAAIYREYDENGRIITESYMKEDNTLINCINGFAMICKEYDDDDNVIYERFLDENSAPIISTFGYAEVRRTYDQKKLVLEEYYGLRGEPLVQAAGHVAILQKWNGDILTSRSYLDSNGNIMMRSDGYAKAVWLQDDQGTWNVCFENNDGEIVPIEEKNLAKDIHIGSDGWSEWMTPIPNTVNSSFNIGYTNLGSKRENDVYSCRVTIEFRDVTATPGKKFGFWSQGEQDGKWSVGNIWDGRLVSLSEAPRDGTYTFETSIMLTDGMDKISIFNLGFRCDNWASGSFRVKEVTIKKGENAEEWSPGI